MEDLKNTQFIMEGKTISISLLGREHTNAVRKRLNELNLKPDKVNIFVSFRLMYITEHDFKTHTDITDEMLMKDKLTLDDLYKISPKPTYFSFKFEDAGTVCYNKDFVWGEAFGEPFTLTYSTIEQLAGCPNVNPIIGWNKVERIIRIGHIDIKENDVAELLHKMNELDEKQ